MKICQIFLALFILLLDTQQPDSLKKNYLNSFENILKEYRFELNITKNSIDGYGGELLLEEAKNAEILMFGENHGVQQIAEFSHVFYNLLSSDEPRILVTEIGPATASEVEFMVRNRNFENFMEEGVNLHSVPFFFLEQEVPLLYSVVENFPDSVSSIWGIDQEFITGSPVVFNYLEKYTKTEEEKKALKKVRRKSFINPFLIGMGSGKALKELQIAYSNSTSKEAKKVINHLILSHKIYKENMGGDSRWSNEARESLMMDNFEHQASVFQDSLPHLFFKFGSYHLSKGRSPTVKEALGLRVDKWAKQRDWSTLNVFVDAIDGETLNALIGNKESLPSIEIWDSSPFKNLVYLKNATLFDLRPLKEHSELKDMHYKIRYMVNSYDYLVLFPSATSSNFLEGTLVTHAYGIVLLVIALIVFFLLVYVIIRVVRKFKTKHTKQ